MYHRLKDIGAEPPIELCWVSVIEWGLSYGSIIGLKSNTKRKRSRDGSVRVLVAGKEKGVGVG